MKNFKTLIIPLITAIIWGGSFSYQRMAVEHLSPFSVNGIRLIIGGLLLLAVNVVRAKSFNLKIKDGKKLINGSLCCGIALFIATNVQQFGIEGASAGKAGFITALYMVLVPVFGIFLGKKVSAKLWGSVAIALAGLYLLSVSGDFTVVPTDLFLLAGALFFAIQILFITYFAADNDGLCLSCGQFLVAGVLSLICMLLFDDVRMENVMAAAWPLLYLAVFSTGIAYTLQVLALKWDGNPTLVTLITSLESVFAVIFGAIILHEMLSGRELTGCGLMLAAVVLARLPERRASGTVKKHNIIKSHTD